MKIVHPFKTTTLAKKKHVTNGMTFFGREVLTWMVNQDRDSLQICFACGRDRGREVFKCPYLCRSRTLWHPHVSGIISIGTEFSKTNMRHSGEWRFFSSCLR